jgi:putative flippase GtrA
MSGKPMIEFIRFLGVGLLSVFIDLIVYLVNYGYLFFNIYLSKALGFIAGMIFSFYANQVWTFKFISVSNTYLRKFLGLYLFSLIINIQLNHALYMHLMSEYKTQIAFLVATIISATLNFCGMKWIVFVNNN